MKLLHAYCCSVPLGSVFCFIHACPFYLSMHAHASSCRTMHGPCIPTCDHHACYMRGIFSLPAGKPVHPKKVLSAFECACGVLTVEAVQLFNVKPKSHMQLEIG